MFSSLIHKYSCGVDFEVKHNADLLLSILFNIPKEHPYFESPLNISVTCVTMPGKLILFPVMDNLKSQGFSGLVRENLTLSLTKSEGVDLFLHIHRS